ncbi:hypothetical protein HYU09_02430 [Candidatus Woesearchaeota archaeon]|nr:hypothetical protein [Candidatus Woesearchaeota archaeon]
MPEKEGSGTEKRLLDTISYLKESGFSSNEIINLVNKLLKVEVKEEVKVPISVFKNDKLGSLEAIVKYLRENLLLSFKQIASLTGRNEIALAVTYRNARKKLESKFVVEEISPYSIPAAILQDRNFSVLENVVSYLKDTFGLTYHKIAVLLSRDDRTIWTVYQRAIKKRKHGQ